MTKTTTIFVASLFFFIVSCSKPEAPVNVTPSPAPAAKAADAREDDNAPRITLADAKKAFDAGEAIFVDARAPEVYKQEHIKGAVNITSATLDSRLAELPKNKKIIVYCS